MQIGRPVFHQRLACSSTSKSLFRIQTSTLSLSLSLSLRRSGSRRVAATKLPLSRSLSSSQLSQMANKHTIILMQTSQNKSTRTFMDYGSISQAMDGICGLYERKLKELNPAIRNISYDIADLYNFIDGLADLSALVYDHSIQAYLPYDRQWIKQRTLRHLQKLAH